MMEFFFRLIVFAVVLGANLQSAAVAQTQSEQDSIPPGEYLLKIGGCIHCHTADGGPRLAGGRALETPFGIFYSPNITSHQTTGIGAWSAEDFRRAMRQGVAPDGSRYYPVFPYTSYTQMHSGDVDRLYSYLMSQPAADMPNREHELPWYLRWRLAARVWQWLFFTPGEFEADPGRSVGSNRGAYIAEALAHCQQCHTPRNSMGALRAELAYAGNPDGPDDELVPNITPDEKTGIGDWSRESLSEFLRFGELPDGEYTAGSMDPVIESIGQLSTEDRNALVEFLRSLEPIENRVGK